MTNLTRHMLANGNLIQRGYSYPLFLRNGDAASTGTYFENGQIVALNGTKWLICGNPKYDVVLTEYRIADEPTPESIEWVKGYRHAAKQVRERAGFSWSAEFHRGWSACWYAKRHDSVDAEIVN